MILVGAIRLIDLPASFCEGGLLRPCLRDTPYTQAAPEEAQRRHTGRSWVHLTFDAAQTSQDDRSTAPGGGD